VSSSFLKGTTPNTRQLSQTGFDAVPYNFKRGYKLLKVLLLYRKVLCVVFPKIVVESCWDSVTCFFMKLEMVNHILSLKSAKACLLHAFI